MVERRTLVLRSEDAWLWVLLAATAIVASEEWGAVGAGAAAAGAAAVATVRARAAPWPVALAALCTAGAAVIHFAVASPHFREWWGFGVFFFVSGWLQLAWSALAPRSVDRRLLWVGLAGNLVVVAVWVVSRTTGLPFGPDPGEAEAIGSADLVSTTLEVIAAAGCAVALVAETRPAGTTRWLVAAAVAATTAYALLAVGGAHS